MTKFTPPPGTVSRVHAERVLVIAPHFDDEVLGCGGLLLQLIGRGAETRVLFLSDGSGGVEEVGDRREYAARRRNEAATVAGQLGVSSFEELGLPDGALIEHLEAISESIRRAVTTFRPDLLLLPSPSEVSADHRAAFRALHHLLAPVRSGDPLYDQAAGLRILLYEVNRPQHPDILVDVGKELVEIQALMALYHSQTKLHDYPAAAAGLRRFRTLSLPPGVRAAEAYRALSLQDFVTRSPLRLTEHLGGILDTPTPRNGPLVSVVIRTRDRPRKLAEALTSVARSTYRDLEVVLVNDGGNGVVIPEGYPFPVVRRDTPGASGPAAAAQLGLAAATGELVGFLDDDDLFFPEHVAILVDRVQETGCPVVYSDAAVGVYERDANRGWQCIDRRLPYSRDFDAARLLVDNYIPFNTVLMQRELANETGPFDETLPFFEDWDFLIRLSARTSFDHVRTVTCEYRHFHEDTSHVFGSDPHARSDFLDGRARIYAKHADRLGPPELARAVSTLRAENSEQAERYRNLLATLQRARWQDGHG